MKILITGGLGFIGSHTAVELLQQGYDVVIVDNLSNSKISVLDKIQIITGKNPVFYNIDICNIELLEKVFHETKIDGVLHFAGLKAVGESVEKPLEYYFNNVVGTLVLLKCCKKYNVNKFVFSSSAAVYGDQESPIREDVEINNTLNPYGETKVMIERILEDYSKSNPMFKGAILRYFNPIGAHESGLIGEDPNGIPNNLMPYITKVAKGELPHLNIFGNDYNTIDGTGVRDYIHIYDLSKGHILAFEKLNEGVEIFNLGSGKGSSVLQLVNAFIKENKIDIPYEVVPRRAGDVAVTFADVTKAKIILGWSPQKSISDMVRDSWKYERENKITN